MPDLPDLLDIRTKPELHKPGPCQHGLHWPVFDHGLLPDVSLRIDVGDIMPCYIKAALIDRKAGAGYFVTGETYSHMTSYSFTSKKFLFPGSFDWPDFPYKSPEDPAFERILTEKSI